MNMKKTTAAFIAILVISVMLCMSSCKDFNEFIETMNSVESSQSSEEPAYSGKELEELSAETVNQIYNEANTAYGWFKLTPISVTQDSKTADGETYYKVDHEIIKSLNGLKLYLEGLFSDAIVKSLLNPENKAPCFRDFDGELYSLNLNGSSNSEVSELSFELVKERPDRYVYRVSYAAKDGPEINQTKSYDFVFQKKEIQWIFTQFPYFLSV